MSTDITAGVLAQPMRETGPGSAGVGAGTSPAPWLGIRSGAGVPTDLLAEAEDTAARAVRAAGVTMVELTTIAQMVEACALLDRVWRPVNGAGLIAPNLLKVLSHCGCYVVAAVRDGRMVGVCIGLLAEFGLHSHIAGVEDTLRGGGLGRAVKLHQRAWSLRRGIDTITWTYDPLISRNAYFNLAKLGVAAAEYLPDYYGAMSDTVNAGIPSDRLLVRWDLASPHVVRTLAGGRPGPELDGAVVALDANGSDGRPAFGRATGSRLLVRIPRDIEAMRIARPEVAAEWRLALRDVLAGLMAAGGRVSGFTREGWYVVDCDDSEHRIETENTV